MSDLGAQWTEQHRLAQVRIGAAAARDALELWRQLNPLRLAESGGAWLRDARAAVGRRRWESRELSAAYVRLLRAFRTGQTLPEPGSPVEVPAVAMGELRQRFGTLAGVPAVPEPDDSVRVSVDGDFDWPEVDEQGVERRATVSLVVTGPVTAQRGVEALRSQRGRLDDGNFLTELDSLMQDAGARVAGAASREALLGGREALEASSRADRKVIGWARVTDADPCWFCALLASRGAVYRNFWTARYSGRASRRRAAPQDPPQGWEDWPPERLAQWETSRGLTRYHNACQCTIVPVYSRTDWVPEASQAFRQLYYEATEGLTGPEARAAFRAALDARRQRVTARDVAVR